MPTAQTVRPTPWGVRVLTCLLALLLLTPAPARAHSELVSSTPADGSTVTAAPRTATLTFSEEVSPSFVEVVVAGPDGAARPATVTARGAVVTAELPSGLAAGRVEVRYRVVSKDGHPITGVIAFTVTAPATAPSSAASSESPAAPSPGSASTTSTAGSANIPSAKPGSSSPAGTATGSETGIPGAIYGLIVMVAVAVALVGAVLLLRRRGRRTAR